MWCFYTPRVARRIQPRPSSRAPNDDMPTKSYSQTVVFGSDSQTPAEPFCHKVTEVKQGKATNLPKVFSLLR